MRRASNSGALTGSFWRATRNRPGCCPAGGPHQGQVRGVVVRGGGESDRGTQIGLGQASRGSVASPAIVATGGPGRLLRSMTVTGRSCRARSSARWLPNRPYPHTTQRPSGGTGSAAGDRGVAVGRQPLDQAVRVRGPQRHA